MNKEKLINQFFEKLLNYAESAESFANKQVPLYVEELLAYGYYSAQVDVWTCGILVGLLSIIFIASLVLDAKIGWNGVPTVLAIISMIFVVCFPLV